MTLKVKYADFQVITRSKTLHAPIVNEGDLLEQAISLLAGTFPPPKGIRLLGITLSSLVGNPHQDQQLSFAL